MSATAKLFANLLNVNFSAGTHAGAGEAIRQGFEQESDLDGLNRLQIFDKALGLVGERAAELVHFRREAKPGDAVAVREMDGLEDFADEEKALGAKALIAGLGEIGWIGARRKRD